jgi:deuterolysin
LQDAAFETIEAKETVEVQWDVAQLHDLSAGGEFNITAEGSLRYAEVGGNRIAGQAIYRPNVISSHIDGVQASKVHKAFHEAGKAKRIVVQSGCSSSQKSTVNAALGVAKTYAQNAQAAATAGTKLQEYFKSTQSSTASTVASVFNKIATSVVNSGTSGSAKLYCTDIGNFCTDGVVAYTQPGSNEYVSRLKVTCSTYMSFRSVQTTYNVSTFSMPRSCQSLLQNTVTDVRLLQIVLCPYWFQFPATGSTCHIADQPYVIIHEATHLTAVKGTDDVCYGYDGCVTAISASQELNNADTYALYANAIQVKC